MTAPDAGNAGNGSNVSSAEKKPERKKRGRIFRFFLFAAAFFGILLLAILIFIQTNYFNNLVLETALKSVNPAFSKKDCEFHASALEGNILKGITLKDISVRVRQDTLLKARSVKVKYDLLMLTSKIISAEEVTIDSPEINMTRIRDENDSLTWNFAYLLKSDKVDEDTATSEFDWGIEAKSVKIIDGKLRIVGEKPEGISVRDFQMPQIDTFGVKNLEVTKLNVDLSGDYFPDRKSVSVNSISFETNSGFNLRDLSLQANLNVPEKTADVRNLSLLTDRSHIGINFIQMNNLNPFEGVNYEEFEKNFTQVDIDIKKINFDDLTFFLPEINFLDSVASLRLYADGNYGDLNIRSLYAELPNSSMSFEGKIQHLDEPENLYMDVTGRDLSIDPADTRRVIPGLPVPDYSHVGKVYVPYARFTGTPQKFDADVDLRSDIGNVRGKGFLDVTKDMAEYKGEFESSRANIGALLKRKDLESSITGDFKAEGRGFDYRTMSGNLQYNISSSRFYGQNISRSQGRLDFDRGNVKLGIDLVSSAANAKVSGNVNISNISNISYKLKGSASRLDISAFTKDRSQRSNLNFDFDINGRGLDVDKLSGNYRINVKRSTYAGIEIPAGAVTLASGSSLQKNISLKTEVLDFTAEGSFSFTGVARALGNNIDNIMSVLKSDGREDSLLQSVSTFSGRCDNFSMAFTASFKDLRALDKLSDSLDMDGHLFANGEIADSCGIFSISTGGYVTDFRFSDSAIASDSIPFFITLKNDYARPGLAGFSASAGLSPDKIFLNGIGVDSARARVFIFDGRDSVMISGGLGDSVSLFTTASVRDSMIADFDTLNFRYKNINVVNNNDISLRYVATDSLEGIDIRRFSIASLGQRVSAKGFYSFRDSSNLKLTANNLRVETYSLLGGEPAIDSSNTLIGNLRNLEIDFAGTMKSPKIEIIAISDVLRFGSTRLGRLDADIRYEDDNFISDVTFTNVNNTGNLKLKGNLPLLITFAEEDEQFQQRKAVYGSRDVNLSAIAKNFQIKVFQQLLPYTKNLEGTLDGSINIVGKAEAPELIGDMNVDSGRVYVTLTKMKYEFDAALATDNAKILIKNSRLGFAKDPTRFISASGYIDLTGLTLSDMKIEMDGSIKAFDKDNGPTELGISGDLWVASGAPRLLLTGREGRFDLTGNLVLVKGNVVFNPFVQEVYNIYNDDFRYGVIIDSVKADGTVKSLVLREKRDSLAVVRDISMNPFQKILYVSSQKEPVKTVARERSGAFIYNVFVSTSENVFLKFIVNEKSQQEFFGEITTELYVDNKENGKMAARGNVLLGDNCYYRFLRKFDATGKVTFSGPVTNPELNIKAEYSGYITTEAGTLQSFFNEVKVLLDVTGQAMNPKIDISLERSGTVETGQNAASDAISFLLFGRFTQQVSFSGSSALGMNLGVSYLSGIVSAQLEKFLPFLINTDVSYVDSESGTIAENTDIRLTAAFGDAIVRFGGQLFKGISNTDFIVDYPVGKLLDSKRISNNLVLRVERIYDPSGLSSSSGSVVSGTRVGSLVYYRIKF